MIYARVHTCDFAAMEAACTSGDDFSVCTLETEHGSLQVGTIICYDREFPESACILMLKGAKIILVPNACEMEADLTTAKNGRKPAGLLPAVLVPLEQGNAHLVAFRSGVRFPTLILVGKNGESSLVVLEGHMRLTAMFLAPECLPVELEVMVGFSEQIERWGCY